MEMVREFSTKREPEELPDLFVFADIGNIDLA